MAPPTPRPPSATASSAAGVAASTGGAVAGCGGVCGGRRSADRRRRPKTGVGPRASARSSSLIIMAAAWLKPWSRREGGWGRPQIVGRRLPRHHPPLHSGGNVCLDTPSATRAAPSRYAHPTPPPHAALPARPPPRKRAALRNRHDSQTPRRGSRLGNSCDTPHRYTSPKKLAPSRAPRAGESHGRVRRRQAVRPRGSQRGARLARSQPSARTAPAASGGHTTKAGIRPQGRPRCGPPGATPDAWPWPPPHCPQSHHPAHLCLVLTAASSTRTTHGGHSSGWAAGGVKLGPPLPATPRTPPLQPESSVWGLAPRIVRCVSGDT